jgi:DNA invertase Pin-like site-specific DNA recombinase
MAKVYSYIRFSTLEQEKGDSYRRQLEKAQDYCLKNNHVFDDHLTIADRGKSAYSKANLESGRLGLFLKAVEDGDVQPGSILFVESFDRISRADLFTAMGVLGQLLDAGITVVANDREYTQATVEKNQFLLLEPIFTFIRGNEESAIKGQRLKEAWKNKRAKGGPLTRRMPAWCKLTDGVITLDDGNAATVRRIFQLGKTMGPKRIARLFNQEQVPQMLARKRRTKGWMSSYISKILYNPQVMGHFQPHRMEKRKRIPDGSVREDYYPQVITPEEFYSMQQTLRSRCIEKGRIGSIRRNLFTHIAYAGNTDAAMHYVDKGRTKRKAVSISFPTNPSATTGKLGGHGPITTLSRLSFAG